MDLSEIKRLVIVSNRLPIVIQGSAANLKVSPASGGLITALLPLLKKKGGLWIGWSGTFQHDPAVVEALLKDFQQQLGFSLLPVNLTEEEVSAYYDGFSNEIIWPLFHDLQFQCHFEPSFWEGYQVVNKKIAEHLLHQIVVDDFVWIHDYHLILVARELRKKGFRSKLVFFLHIPFAPLDIFMKIPWRFEILRGMLDYDFIGFQTMRDQRNFINCVRMLLKDVKIKSWHHQSICQLKDHTVRIGTFPISIDFNEFASLAQEPAVIAESERIRKSSEGLKIVFSIDRLDYTKGIPYRLQGIAHFLENHPEFHEKVTFVEVVIPSRTEIPEYDLLKQQIDRLVGAINSKYTKQGWVPIHYVFHSLNKKELVAYYRTADVALVTPVKDGMNLVSKEYAASNVDENGVLILSEFAGAASQLSDYALLVNPFDVVGLGEAIYRALTIPEAERKERMRKMRQSIRHHDIYHWVNSIVTAMGADPHEDASYQSEYMPSD